MEPIAENRYTLTKKLFHEGMEAVVKMNYGKVINRGALALIVALVALAVAMILMKQHPIVILMEAFFMFLAALWLKVYFPWHKAQKAWKQVKNRCGEDMERVTCFYIDQMTVTAAGRETKMRYRDLDHVLTTEHLLIFVAQDRTGILVKRDAFTVGNEEKALELISHFA